MLRCIHVEVNASTLPWLETWSFKSPRNLEDRRRTLKPHPSSWQGNRAETGKGHRAVKQPVLSCYSVGISWMAWPQYLPAMSWSGEYAKNRPPRLSGTARGQGPRLQGIDSTMQALFSSLSFLYLTFPGPPPSHTAKPITHPDTGTHTLADHHLYHHCRAPKCDIDTRRMTMQLLDHIFLAIAGFGLKEILSLQLARDQDFIFPGVYGLWSLYMLSACVVFAFLIYLSDLADERMRWKRTEYWNRKVQEIYIGHSSITCCNCGCGRGEDVCYGYYFFALVWDRTKL